MRNVKKTEILSQEIYNCTVLASSRCTSILLLYPFAFMHTLWRVAVYCSLYIVLLTCIVYSIQF